MSHSELICSSYRLCPEHAQAEGLEDSYLATVDFLQHAEDFDVDPRRIAVAGNYFCAKVNVLSRV